MIISMALDGSRAHPRRTPPIPQNGAPTTEAGAVHVPIPPDERRRLGELSALGLLDSDPDQAFDEVTRLAQRVFGTDIALVSLIDHDRQWFKSRRGLAAEETPRDQAFCAHAIADDDDVFVVENALEDPRFVHNPLVTEDPTIRFYAGAPVHGPQGHRVGTLCVIDGEQRSASAEDRGTLRDLAAIIEREIAHAAVAVTDPLTELHNRRGLQTAARHLLAMAARREDPVCVVYADIDGLKAINDHGGHHDGDGAIIAAAKILKDSLREADIVARIGGDEFAALLYGADAASMEQPLARLSAALDVHNSQPAQLQPVALSLGWVQWVEGEDLDACLRRADEAMYGSKHHPSDSR